MTFVRFISPQTQITLLIQKTGQTADIAHMKQLEGEVSCALYEIKRLNNLVKELENRVCMCQVTREHGMYVAGHSRTGYVWGRSPENRVCMCLVTQKITRRIKCFYFQFTTCYMVLISVFCKWS